MPSKTTLIGLNIGCYHELNQEVFAQEGIDYNKKKAAFAQDYLKKILNPSAYKQAGSGDIPTISHHIHVSPPEDYQQPNQVSINKTVLTINRLNDLEVQWQHFIWTNNQATIPDNIQSLKNIIIKDIKEFAEHSLYGNILDLLTLAPKEERLLSQISDLLRYLILQKFGGAYFDGDYDLLDAKKLYELMQVYNILMGQEPQGWSSSLGNSFIVAQPHHPVIKTAVELSNRNLNAELLPEYVRYPCSLLSKHMYTTGPAMLTIAFYKSANASNNDLLAMDSRIFFNKAYIDYITPNTSCYRPDSPVEPINDIDGFRINTIGADTWCHAWPQYYRNYIYYPDKLNVYLYGATMSNNTNLMLRYIEAGADVNYIYNNDTALALAVRNQNVPSVQLLIEAGAIVDDKIKQIANSTGHYTLVRALSKLSKLDEIGCYANHTEILFAQEGYNYLAEDKKINAHFKLFAPNKLPQEDLSLRIPARMVKIYITSVTAPKPIDNIAVNKTITTFTRLKQADSSWVFDFFTNNKATLPDTISSITGVRVHDLTELREQDPEFWDNIVLALISKAELEQYYYAQISDILRIIALLAQGGFYQDLDGEVYRPETFNALRKYNFVGGKELDNQLTYIGNAFFGASAGHPIIKDSFNLIKRNLLTDRSLLPEYLQFPCNIGCKIIYETGSPLLTIAYFKNANQNNSLDIIFPNKVFFNRDYARYITPESRCHDPKATASLDNEIDNETVESIAGDPFCGSWGLTALTRIYYHENQNYDLYEAALLGNVKLLEEAIADKADVNQPHFRSGIAPLNIAAYNGHYPIVKKLLEHGANTEITNDGSTALLWAVSNKHLDIINLLLEYKANINATRPNNASALFIATYLKDSAIVKTLLAKGARTDSLFAEDTAESYARKNNLTEIVQIFDDYKLSSLEMKLNVAASTGDYHEVKRLLDLGADKDAIIGTFTALQTAAFFEQEAVVDLLLDYGAKIVSEGGFSALNMAQVKHSHTAKGKTIYQKIVKAYLNSGLFDTTQFIIARYNESLTWALTELVNEDVIIYNKGPDDLTYLPSNFKIIKLPNKGREAHTYFYHITNNYNDLSKRTVFLQGDPYEHPLTLPIKRLKYEEPKDCKNIIAKCTTMQPTLLIKSLDLQQQIENHYKNFTISYSLVEFVHSQIDPFYDVNTTLYMVNGAQFAVIRENILKHPISFYQKLISCLNDPNPLEGYYYERIWDLVFSSKTNPIERITKELINAIMKNHPLSVIAKWLSWDIDVNYKDQEGLNALHRASLYNRYDTIPLLLLKGFDVNSVTNGQGKITPLHICALNNFLEACQILIKMGADVNYPTDNGFSPLNQAILGNHTAMVLLLIEHGAEVVHDRFMNPLELTAQLEHYHLHKILLTKYHENLKALDLKNKLACPVTNISIVVVTVNEDLAWIPHEFPCHDVTVYNKGERNLTNTPYYRVKRVENIGYYDGTIIKYIVDNYDTLNQKIKFLQGNPYEVYDFMPFYRAAGELNSTCHNIICKCDTAPHNLHTESFVMQEFDGATKIHGKYKNFNYQNNNLSAFANTYLDVKIPYIFPICYGGQYIVDRDVIMRHKLEYYQKLSNSINYHQYPIEAFYFEILNDLIYAEPLGKAIEQIDI